jgi:hypothetical protein
VRGEIATAAEHIDFLCTEILPAMETTSNAGSALIFTVCSVLYGFGMFRHAEDLCRDHVDLLYNTSTSENENAFLDVNSLIVEWTSRVAKFDTLTGGVSIA